MSYKLKSIDENKYTTNNLLQTQHIKNFCKVKKKQLEEEILLLKGQKQG